MSWFVTFIVTTYITLLLCIVVTGVQLCHQVFRKRTISWGKNYSYPLFEFVVLLPYVVVLGLAAHLSVRGLEVSNYFNIAGRLPSSDAAGYFGEALNAVENGLFTSWMCRRPIWGAFLASLFGITSQNLTFVLHLLAAFEIIVIYLSCVAVHRYLGLLPSLLFGTVQLFYLPIMSNSIITERLGFLLGTMSVIALMSGLMNSSMLEKSVGIFLLALGLFARAGAFFVLLFLLFAVFRSGHRVRKSWTILTFGVSAIVLAFCVHVGVVRSYCPSEPERTSVSNFSYTLYGIASGGKGWEHVIQEHPELNKLTINERAKRIYEMSWKLIASKPSLFARGLVVGLSDYLSGSMWQLPPPFFPFELLLVVSVILSLIQTYRSKKNSEFNEVGLLVGVTIVGLLLSSLVIGTDGGKRVFAATIPFYSLALAYGFAGIQKTYGSVKSKAIPRWLFRTGLAGACAVVILVIFSPLFSQLSRTESFPTASSCEEGENFVVLRYIPGELLNLVSTSPRNSDSNEVELLSFRRTLNPKEDVATLLAIPADSTLIVGFDLIQKKVQYLVVPGIFNFKSQVQGFCVAMGFQGSHIWNLARPALS